MSVELTAQTLSEAVKEGFERMKRYRKSRAMFVKDYVGHYFQTEQGLTGEMPINLVFMAIHALVPALIQREGMNRVMTEFLAYKDYAELLGLAVDKLQKQLRLRQILRAGVVDMCLGGLMIAKTSIAASGNLLPVGDDEDVDAGMIYTDLISPDDFTFDPTATAFDKGSFLGHRVRVPRQILLDYGWDRETVKRIPAANTHPQETGWVASITQDSKQATTMHDIQEYVYVVEVYVPDAGFVVYIPDPYQCSFDDFLHTQEYYGPTEGLYTIGSLTQPVPDNPFPIAPVGIWRDLNVMANEIFKKFMGQSERQKDILLYQPQLADVADAIRTAMDGEAIACNDPKGVNVTSFGGQNPDNERMVQELRGWFNYMAGNPDQLMGIGSEADTATEFQGNQANATVRIQDMRDMISDVQAEISRKHAWFLHTDPLLFSPGQPGIPLIRRSTGNQPVQVWLTPEQRQGDFLDFSFEIVKRSMTVLEPNLRAKRLLEFKTNVIPAETQAAMMMMQMGIPYNLARSLMQTAEEMGIADALQEVFEDPTFAQRLQLMMQMGPQNAGKGSMDGVIQNKGFAGKREIFTPQQEQNQAIQAGGAEAQSAMGFGGNTSWQ